MVASVSKLWSALQQHPDCPLLLALSHLNPDARRDVLLRLPQPPPDWPPLHVRSATTYSATSNLSSIGLWMKPPAGSNPHGSPQGLALPPYDNPTF
jgi:hypothetical protein